MDRTGAITLSIGVDVGYGFTKAVTGEVKISLPSVSGQAVSVQDLGLAKSPDYHMLEPHNIFVGDLAVEQLLGWPDPSDEWFESINYEALLLTALAASTNSFFTSYVLVSGLPVRLMHLEQKLTAQLTGEFKVRMNGGSGPKTFRNVFVKVVAQGLGPLLMHLFDESGLLMVTAQELKAFESVTIDLGSRTTNYISATGIRSISKRTHTEFFGAWDIVREVRTALDDRFGPSLCAGMTHHKLIEIAEARSIVDRGMPTDISILVDPILKRSADSVIAAARELWGEARNVDAFYICGGASRMLGDHIKKELPHATVVEDAFFANAEGYARLAKFIQKERSNG